MARSILEKWGWPPSKGGHERGNDYNHSTYCDLIISGLIGVKPRADEWLVVHPLVPDDTWDYFCLDNLMYHGKLVSVAYDASGNRYHMGKGLHVCIDGRNVARSDRLERIQVPLDGQTSAPSTTGLTTAPECHAYRPRVSRCMRA